MLFKVYLLNLLCLTDSMDCGVHNHSVLFAFRLELTRLSQPVLRLHQGSSTEKV